MRGRGVCARCYPQFEFERTFLETLARVRREHSDPERVRERVLTALQAKGSPPRDRPVARGHVEQMREVDRLMVEEYRIELIQMMENAGRSLAHLALTRLLGGDPRGRSVVVLCGTGGNGGGGLVCARRLHGWGADVRVVTTAPDDRFRGVPAHQLDVVRRVGVPVLTRYDAPLPPADLLIDALIGYSLVGAPTSDAARLGGALLDRDDGWAPVHRAPRRHLLAPHFGGVTQQPLHGPPTAAGEGAGSCLPVKEMRSPSVIQKEAA